MTNKPADTPNDPNLAGFRAILKKKKQNQTAAEALPPQNLARKQKPRAKPQMRRRP